MEQLDGNIWHTSFIMHRIKELDEIVSDLEIRSSKYPSQKIRANLDLTRKTLMLNYHILERLNPNYYKATGSNLLSH